MHFQVCFLSIFLACSHASKGGTNSIATPTDHGLHASDSFMFFPMDVVIPSLSESPKPIRATKKLPGYAEQHLTTANSFSPDLQVHFLRFGC